MNVFVLVGIPLWRVDVFVRTLHPDITGRRFRWQVDTNVSISSATYDLDTAEPRRVCLKRFARMVLRSVGGSQTLSVKRVSLYFELHEEGVTRSPSPPR